MSLLDSVGGKMRRTMSFALLVVFLSLGAIGGCGSSNNDSYDFAGSGQSGGSEGSDGSDGGFGGEETPETQTPGCNASDQSKCIMVTFDDSYGPEFNGRTTDVIPVLYKDQKNLDGSDVRMTYFATLGYSASLDGFDMWASSGNEIANHTVSHFVKDSGEQYPSLFTQKKWYSEMKDLYEILHHWTSITANQNVVGFRQPFFFPGLGATSEEEEADVAWRSAYSSYLNYLISKHPVDGKGFGFSTETLFYFSNHATAANNGPMKTTINQATSFAPLTVYNVTVPLLGKRAKAMELPVCGGNSGIECGRPAKCDKPTTPPPICPGSTCLPIKACLDWGSLDNAITHGPTLISLHPQEITAHPDFAEWASEQRQPNGYTFITMSEFVYLSAQLKGTVPEGSYVTPDTYENLVTGTPKTCVVPGVRVPGSTGNYGYASQCRGSADGDTCNPDPYIAKPANVGKYVCNLACEDPNGTPDPTYGDHCFANSKTPTSTGKFITFNKCDEPNNFDTKRITWEPGSFPWLGNPTGNAVTGTSCNTFPENACQATDFKGKCAPPPAPPTCATNAATWVSTGISWKTGKSWKSGDVAVCDDVSDCLTKSTNPYCCLSGEEAFCSTTDPSNASASPFWAAKPQAPLVDEE